MLVGRQTAVTLPGPSSTAAAETAWPPAVNQPAELVERRQGRSPARSRTGTAVSSVETSLPYSPP